MGTSPNVLPPAALICGTGEINYEALPGAAAFMHTQPHTG